MAAVVMEGVSKVYGRDVLAVDDIQLEVAEGELLVLLGPSGCGKTTLLRMIAGLEDMSSGNLWLGGELANHMPPQVRNVAMVFQHGALYPHLTVRRNLAFPLKAARPQVKIDKQDKLAIDARVTELARGLGLEEMLDRMPRMLSGGERQRVAIGRALIRGEPTVLLMDEPLASLDARMRIFLRAEIESLVRSMHLTTVYVTHDQTEALAMADRIAVIHKGKLEDIGTPTRIYADPATAFVAAFLGSPPINMVSATIWVEIGERLIIDFGPQSLYLPWSDPRAGSLTPYHGQQVIVGIRPDVLTPVGEANGRGVLRGRVHSLEYHGHEWLARLEMGLHLVHISTGVDPPAPAQETSKSRGHRRASLLLRLETPSGWSPGQEVSIAVDVPRVFFFTAEGRRIDKSPYED